MDTEYQWQQDESGQWYYLAGDGNWHPYTPPDDVAEAGSWHEGETEDHPTGRRPSASTSQTRVYETNSYLAAQTQEDERRQMSQESRTEEMEKTLNKYTEVLIPKKKGDSSRKSSRKNADDSKTRRRK